MNDQKSASRHRLMTESRIIPLILRLAAPTTVGMFVTALYSMTDALFVSSLGTEASAAVGVTFAFLNVSIVPAVSFIGVVTFSLSAVGVYIGHLFGAKFKSKAELAGGIVLILMGLRILLEHLGVLDWFFGLFA